MEDTSDFLARTEKEDNSDKAGRTLGASARAYRPEGIGLEDAEAVPVDRQSEGAGAGHREDNWRQGVLYQH